MQGAVNMTRPLFLSRMAKYALCSWLMAGILALSFSHPAHAKDYVMLKIADQEMTAQQVSAAWQALFPKGTAPDLETIAPKLRSRFLQGFITQQVLLAEAKKAGIAENESVKKAIQAASQQIITRAFLDSKTQTATSDDALKSAYAKLVTARKAQSEIRVRHILLHSETQARRVYDALKQGRSFSVLAAEYSKDPVSAESGGDLGYLLLEEMSKSFANAVAALKKNVASTPVKTDFGWHIIEVTNTRKASIPSFHQAREALRLSLQQRALKHYISQLVAQSAVIALDAQGNEINLDEAADEAEKTPLF
jgi:peptidyl-prolyl cis-trans isomerase C